MELNVFTAQMRREFLAALNESTGAAAPVDPFLTTIPSTAKIETYPTFSPPPGLQEYKGFRRLSQQSPVTYSVANKAYDATLSVDLDDVMWDKVGGYLMNVKDLADKARAPFRSRLVLQHLAAGESQTCFDGSNFFDSATSRKIGDATEATSAAVGATSGGGNVFGYTPTVAAGTAAADDSATHRLYLLIHSGRIKPLVFQNAKEPEMMTDAGTPASSKSKRADYWVDVYGAAAFGAWWDAVLIKFTNTPNVQGIYAALNIARKALRKFKYSKAQAGDPDEFVHSALQFAPGSSSLVMSTDLETVVETAINPSRIGVTPATNSGVAAAIQDNIWANKFNLVASPYV